MTLGEHVHQLESRLEQISAGGQDIPALIDHFIARFNVEEGKLAINWDDELVKATALTRDGAVVHPNFQPKTAA